MSRAAGDRLTDREFIQLCAEWPYAQLPLAAALRLSLLVSNDQTGMARRALMFARHTSVRCTRSYAVTPVDQVTT